MAQNPKAFISHSRDDNERFVIAFSERLRAKGIDAWLDFWEMLPGDSLIDKIWNEGLKNCDVFLVVLSTNSIGSKWVRDELNTGIVKKIEDKTKLIAIRLDACEVPEPLRSTIWIDIPDPANYDREFERIVNAIHGQYGRPPLGEKPAYVRPDVLNVGNLTRIDSVIFKHACQIAIEQGQCDFISGKQLVTDLGKQGISEAQIMETQNVLKRRHYIKMYPVLGPPHAYEFSITKMGFDQFARTGIPHYGKLCADVARCLVREEHMNNRSVAEALNQPIRIVDHVFESLESNGLIEYGKSIDGGGGPHIDVFWVSPELRRKLEPND